MLPNNPPRQSSNLCPGHRLTSTQTCPSTISCIHNDTNKRWVFQCRALLRSLKSSCYAFVVEYWFIVVFVHAFLMMLNYCSSLSFVYSHRYIIMLHHYGWRYQWIEKIGAACESSSFNLNQPADHQMQRRNNNQPSAYIRAKRRIKYIISIVVAGG